MSMMIRSLVIFAIFALLSNFTFALTPSAELDQVKSLPGWNAELPSRHFSGYLSVPSLGEKTNTTSHLHYYLVEAESNPQDAATVIWFNGGPGCSSLDGWAYEHGPFEISADGKILTERPHRWNRIVNMLFIEAPVGVGFSYSDNKDYNTNDDRTALENMAAVEAFYVKFPELLKNDLFITGESYAGVYVPTLAEAIVKATQAGTYNGAKLVGMAAGNGCSGTDVGICSNGPAMLAMEWFFYSQTSFIEPSLKDSVNANCDWESAKQNIKGSLSSRCLQLMNQVSEQLAGINTYNTYGECISDMCDAYGNASPYATPQVRGKIPAPEVQWVPEDETAPGVGMQKIVRLTPHGPNACLDSGAASAYFNRDDVMEAIHVRDPGFCWAICNTARNWKYTSTRTNLPRDTYPLLIQNIRVLIYNGDWDGSVPYTDGMAWTQSLNLPIESAWHTWKYTEVDGTEQVGGKVVDYDVSGVADPSSPAFSKPSFSFVTVRGGRHEVPETAPWQALDLLQRFVDGTKW